MNGEGKKAEEGERKEESGRKGGREEESGRTGGREEERERVKVTEEKGAKPEGGECTHVVGRQYCL